MQFLTDAWEPIELETNRQSGKTLGTLEFRHYSLIIAAVIFFLAPIGWVATGDWGVASICVGIAILIASAVAIGTGRKRNRIA
jgi:hypothetical protein